MPKGTRQKVSCIYHMFAEEQNTSGQVVWKHLYQLPCTASSDAEFRFSGRQVSGEYGDFSEIYECV